MVDANFASLSLSLLSYIRWSILLSIRSSFLLSPGNDSTMG